MAARSRWVALVLAGLGACEQRGGPAPPAPEGADVIGACVVTMGRTEECWYVSEAACGIPVRRGVTCQALGYTMQMGPEKWTRPVVGACITRGAAGATCRDQVLLTDCPEGVFAGQRCEDVADRWR